MNGFEPGELRRILHRHPEPGWAEFFTTATLLRELEGVPGARVHMGEALGMTVRMGVDEQQQQTFAELAERAGVQCRLIATLREHGTGLIVDLGAEDPARRVVLRFDIDALPVSESADPAHSPARSGYSSRIPGYSHACGHDGHAAIGVGVARELSRRRAEMPEDAGVRLVFQPAEEGTRGARAIIEAGWVDDAAAVFALHLDGRLSAPAGAIVPGVIDMLATRKIDIHVRGRAAHSSESPEAGIDALSTAVDIYRGLTENVWTGGRVSCNVLEGGSSRNVIAERAVLRCEVRSKSNAIAEQLSVEVERLAIHAGRKRGAAVDVRPVGMSAGGRSDRLGTAMMRSAAERLGLPVCAERGLGASDDAADMIELAQRAGGFGAYALLAGGVDTDAHSSTFDVTDEALAHGVAVMTQCALDACASGKDRVWGA